MGESMIGYFSLFESNTMGSLTTRKTYGLKGYRDRCPRYPATSGGWRLRPPAYQLSPLKMKNTVVSPERAKGIHRAGTFTFLGMHFVLNTKNGVSLPGKCHSGSGKARLATTSPFTPLGLVVFVIQVQGASPHTC